MRTESQPEQLTFVPAEFGFNVTETNIINRLESRLEGPGRQPLLTIDEDDQLINNQRRYFQKIVAGVITTNLKPAEIRARQQRAEAAARTDKARRYSEELIKAVFAVDSCRSFWRYLNDQGADPIRLNDDQDVLTRRLSQYVADLLLAARQSRLIIGPPIAPACEMIVAKFKINPQEQTRLTVLAGKNQVLKANLWAGQLQEVSRQWRLIDKETISLLRNHDQGRIKEYRPKLPLIAEVLNKIDDAQANQSS